MTPNGAAAIASYKHMHHIEIITRLQGEQIEDLAGLIDAATEADGHEPVGEHKFLRLRQGDDLALGVLAYEAGRLTGYAHTLIYGTGEDRRISCEIVVHPDMRRRGIGTALLQQVVEHARAEGARRLGLWAYNDSPASRHMAQAFGLETARRLLHMHRHPEAPPHVEAPEGVTIRPFRVGEDADWLRLNNHIFRGHPENGEWTIEDFRARTRQPWFRPEDLLILEADGDSAGFCWLKIEDRENEGNVGEIYVIGTAPEYQGRGLGKYLLSRALDHLSGRSVDAVAVYVDESNAAAVTLYTAFDFHHHHVDICYTLPLPAVPPAESSAATTRGG